MNQIPITRNGHELLKKELLQLKSKDRPSVIQAIADARSHGDLSENAEYDAAKEKQAFIEGRLAEIEAKLSQAIVIDPTALNGEGKCVFASTVTVEDLDSEIKSIYQIVGDDEADIKNNLISVNSPIARGLIGKQMDDAVTIKTPKGDVEYEIIEVEYL